jgi:hypothetical protein
MSDIVQIKRTIREVVNAERFEKVTERSISDARQAMLKERRELEALGLRFDPFRDGRIIRERRKK